MNKILFISFAFLLVFSSVASAEYRDVLPYSSQMYLDTNTMGVSNTNEFTFKQGANLDSSVILRLNRANKNTSTVGVHGTVSIYPDTTAATNSASITLAGTTGAITATSGNITTLTPTTLTVSGTASLNGSSIGLGNAVAADTVTLTADFVAAANADIDLDASGVTVEMATGSATTFTVGTLSATTDFTAPEGTVSGKELTNTMATKVVSMVIPFYGTADTVPVFIADAACTIASIKVRGIGDYSSDTQFLAVHNLTKGETVVNEIAAGAGAGVNLNFILGSTPAVSLSLVSGNADLASGNIVAISRMTNFVATRFLHVTITVLYED